MFPRPFLHFFNKSEISTVGGVEATLPVDVVAGALVAYGTKSLTTNWLSGKLFDCLDNGYATHTIYAINGLPDVVTFASILGVDPITGSGFLPLLKMYDQSGNGLDAVQTSGTSGYYPVIMLYNGEVSIVSDGVFQTNAGGNTYTQYLVIPNGLSTNNQSIASYFVSTLGQSTSIIGNPGHGDTYWANILLNTGTAFGSGFAYFTAGGGQNSGPMGSNLEDWNGALSNSAALPSAAQRSVHHFNCSASSMVVGSNEETLTIANSLSAGTASGGWLFSSPITADYGVYGRTEAIVLYPTQNSTDSSKIRNSLYTLFEITGSPKYNVVVDGSSIEMGWGSIPSSASFGNVSSCALGWDQQIEKAMRLYGQPIKLSNTSVPAGTVEDCNTNFPYNATNFFSSAFSKNILFATGFCNHNSFSAGDNAATAYTALQSYITQAKAAHTWDTIFVFISGENTAYDALVKAGAATMGITLIDFTLPAYTSTLPGDWSTSNSKYYNQSGTYVGTGIHPTALGYSYTANYILGYLKTALGV